MCFKNKDSQFFFDAFNVFCVTLKYAKFKKYGWFKSLASIWSFQYWKPTENDSFHLQEIIVILESNSEYDAHLWSEIVNPNLGICLHWQHMQMQISI